MGKRRTISFTLSDGQIVTCRDVANVLGISECAARNRLNKSNDPKKIFEPYNPAKGGKPRGKQKKPKQLLPYEEPLWKLVMQMGKKTK
mgnify:CR=1 FL=1|tara:strand:- start:215 stop:478 length:264 start_codon:yes stop_codon:yes gene_type:complete